MLVARRKRHSTLAGQRTANLELLPWKENNDMEMRNFVARNSLTMWLVSGIALVACFGICAIGGSPAFARKKYEWQAPIFIHGATHFVALNGSDTGPGTANRPWATINYAAVQAVRGDTVVVRGGHYLLAAQVKPRNSGQPDAWITFLGYPGEHPILDARMVERPSSAPVGFNNGAFQIEGVSYIRVANLTIINSHDAGFTVRDSSNVDLINNSTNGTFSSGIAVWDTNHKSVSTRNIRIIGNIITKATTWDLAPPNLPKQGSAPQEALSVAGAINFEVAYNHVYDSSTAGIDIKETSKHGMVHHNLVDNVLFGMYVDAWFGEISDIEIFNNVIHDCRTAGFGVSVENGKSVDGVEIHNNLIFNNGGSGFYFSRWGVNNTRRNIQIVQNTFYHNGYSVPAAGQTYYWMTGGLYLYSTELRDILIKDNIFSDNRGFQIGYSELYLKNGQTWPQAAGERNIRVIGNLISGQNSIESPIKSGGDPPDRVDIYAINGARAILSDPLFKDFANQDFTLKHNSPAAGHDTKGAYPTETRSYLWWKAAFPPLMYRSHLYRREQR